MHSKINSLSPLCPLCEDQEETVDHALLKCEYTSPKVGLVPILATDAAYKATDGKDSFGYVALIKGVIVDAGA